MSSTSSSKRQLPNLQSESTDKIRHLNTALINTENNLRHAQQNFELLKQIQTQQPNTSSSLLDAFRSNGTSNFDVDGSSRRSTSSSSQHQRSSSNKGVRFTDDHIGQSLHQFNNELQSLSTEHGRLKTEIHRTRKSTTLNESDDGNESVLSRNDPLVEEIVQSRLDRRVQEIEQEIKRDKDQQQQIEMRSLIAELQQQRKNPPSVHHDEEKIAQARILLAESNKQMYESQLQNTRRALEESEMNKNLLTQQVSQLREQLLRNELEREKFSREEDLALAMNRRRRTESDRLQMENEYLYQQMSKSSPLNELVQIKKDLDKSERQRDQLSDHLEVLMKKCEEKENVLGKTLIEFKDLTETCETLERQNQKLQNDLSLALEKLEEMTREAERYAQEALNLQKQLADSEQKREEFRIQAQETVKQWKAKVKKLEKDLDGHKFGSTQMLERNEQLIRDLDATKTQNSTFKDQIGKLENELADAHTTRHRLEEHFKRTENDMNQIRQIRSTHENEIIALKNAVNDLESQLAISRQRQNQIEKEKENLHDLLQEEINHRNHVDSKCKQNEQNLETLHQSRSQLQQHVIDLENERMDFIQKIKEIEFERDAFSLQLHSATKTFNDEKTKFQSRLASLESDYEETKRKFETSKIEFQREMKTMRIEYENKIENLKLQTANEKARGDILQRHENEHKKEIERLQEKASKFEDEATQNQFSLETLSRELKEKTRLIEELESKINRLLVDATNDKNQTIRKEKDYQNSLHTVYNDIIYCTECLSNDSDEPFIIETTNSSRDDIENWLSKVKARLAWLKQELEIRQQQENKLRHDLNSALLDSEADRKYFAAELGKREVIIEDLAREKTSFQRETSDKMKILQHQLAKVEGHSTKEIERTKQLQTIEMQMEYEKRRALTEDEKDRINDRYRQQFQKFQTMIDSVKRELHTAKVQLATKSS